MTISPAGLNLIKQFEGLRLEAYKCPAGVWTVGYGSTSGVRQGMVITASQAEERLRRDVQSAELMLNSVGVNFAQSQFDALCSWIFNLGCGSFGKSTLRRFIIEDKGDLDITDQLVKWHNAGGRPLVGLKRRRIAEANLFLESDIYHLDSKSNIVR